MALLFLTICIMMALVLRSLRLALVSIPPNLLPLVLAYAAMAVVDLPLDPLAAVVLVVGLGIAVDDTIHLIVRHREEASSNALPDRAIEAAVASTGRAVAYTSIVLAAGLSINTLSSFPPLRVLGTLGAALIILALLSDLLLLPALLVLARRRQPTSGLGSPPGS